MKHLLSLLIAGGVLVAQAATLRTTTTSLVRDIENFCGDHAKDCGSDVPTKTFQDQFLKRIESLIKDLAAKGFARESQDIKQHVDGPPRFTIVALGRVAGSLP